MRKKLLRMTAGLAIVCGFSTVMIINYILQNVHSPEEYSID